MNFARKRLINLLKETMEDTKEELYQSKDEDAKIDVIVRIGVPKTGLGLVV